MANLNREIFRDLDSEFALVFDGIEPPASSLTRNFSNKVSTNFNSAADKIALSGKA